MNDAVVCIARVGVMYDNARDSRPIGAGDPGPDGGVGNKGCRTKCVTVLGLWGVIARNFALRSCGDGMVSELWEEGGDATTGGVGGYECTLTLIRISPGEAFSGGGSEVRIAKVRAPSGCSGLLSVGRVAGSEISGDDGGLEAGGVRGMNASGGKEGHRTRRYQPRLGRWIDHLRVPVVLSWAADIDDRDKANNTDIPQCSQRSRPLS